MCTAEHGADKVWLNSCGRPTASSPGVHLVFLYIWLLSGTLEWGKILWPSVLAGWGGKGLVHLLHLVRNCRDKKG